MPACVHTPQTYLQQVQHPSQPEQTQPCSSIKTSSLPVKSIVEGCPSKKHASPLDWKGSGIGSVLATLLACMIKDQM